MESYGHTAISGGLGRLLYFFLVIIYLVFYVSKYNLLLGAEISWQGNTDKYFLVNTLYGRYRLLSIQDRCGLLGRSTFS